MGKTNWRIQKDNIKMGFKKRSGRVWDGFSWFRIGQLMTRCEYGNDLIVT
jgi:hypothetical protein